jgi:signal transduction histidine kinase
MGNLAAGIAHEIGNPLNAIKLTVSHLKDMASRRELDGSSFETYSDGILNEVNRLDRIVRDFLTLAKERELLFQPYGIDKLLRETVRLIEKDAQKRGIDIHSNIPACAEEALIDSQMLKGAILNILLNAMEASEKDRVISVTLEESDGRVVIRVADQGKGIPEEIMDRVFEPYFTTKTSGTGLGLSLTRTIIEKHNGDISLESRQGQGTTVSITIPAESK